MGQKIKVVILFLLFFLRKKYPGKGPSAFNCLRRDGKETEK